MKAKKYRLPPLVKIGFSVFVLIIIGLGVGYYMIEKRAVQQEAEEKLASIARLKVDQIAAWRKERLKEGAEITIRPDFAQLLASWLADPQDETRTMILAEFLIFKQMNGHQNVLLVDANGTTRLGLNGPTEDPNQYASEMAAAFRDRMPVLTELHADKENPEPHISVVSPLFFDKAQSRPAGAVILVTDPSEFLYPPDPIMAGP